jgi:hypothetical protein
MERIPVDPWTETGAQQQREVAGTGYDAPGDVDAALSGLPDGLKIDRTAAKYPAF